jgi:Protein of unknown function (DUF2462)
MAQGKIKLRSEVKRGSHLPTGKGWRLVRPKKTRALKAALLKTFSSAGQRFAIFRIVR